MEHDYDISTDYNESGHDESGHDENESEHDTEIDDDYNYDYDCDLDDSPIKLNISSENISDTEYEELCEFERLYKLDEQAKLDEQVKLDEQAKLYEQAVKRIDFIYEQVFNNYQVPAEVLIDFTIGTVDDWSNTCGRFNKGEMLLEFATLYMYMHTPDKVVILCDNIHPFIQDNRVNELTNLFNANIIHD